MKKVFIDCGANVGQSIDNFIKKWPDWEEYEMHSFEANPRLTQHFLRFSKITNFTFHQAAIWKYTGEVDFFIDESYNTYGSSVSSDKRGNSKTPLTVACVDLDSFIRTYSEQDFIILKMDIEGGEYDLIEYLLQKNTFTYINKFYIELHTGKVGKTKNDDIELLEKLSKYTNLTVYSDTYNDLNFL
jgi:FkbM family methyltransferase